MSVPSKPRPSLGCSPSRTAHVVRRLCSIDHSVLLERCRVRAGRVTRGRVKKVQVRLQRCALCAGRCACLASVCVRCVYDMCCRKRVLVFRSVAVLRSGDIMVAAAFILLHRLLLPRALQADPPFRTRQGTETIKKGVIFLINALCCCSFWSLPSIRI